MCTPPSPVGVCHLLWRGIFWGNILSVVAWFFRHFLGEILQNHFLKALYDPSFYKEKSDWGIQLHLKMLQCIIIMLYYLLATCRTLLSASLNSQFWRFMWITKQFWRLIWIDKTLTANSKYSIELLTTKVLPDVYWMISNCHFC